jgi:NAD(P)-dependent dehydrogenase (short-subunit alcohol dehydrogenase family)
VVAVCTLRIDGDQESVDNQVSWVDSEFGRLDILVNTAHPPDPGVRAVGADPGVIAEAFERTFSERVGSPTRASR